MVGSAGGSAPNKPRIGISASTGIDSGTARAPPPPLRAAPRPSGCWPSRAAGQPDAVGARMFGDLRERRVPCGAWRRGSARSRRCGPWRSRLGRWTCIIAPPHDGSASDSRARTGEDRVRPKPTRGAPARAGPATARGELQRARPRPARKRGRSRWSSALARQREASPAGRLLGRAYALTGSRSTAFSTPARFLCARS